MRARELLDENYTVNLQSDLDNILLTAKAAGQDKMDLNTILSVMRGMGYSVDKVTINSLLGDRPYITGVTPDAVTFASPEAPSQPDPTEDSAEKVKDLAADAVDIG